MAKRRKKGKKKAILIVEIVVLVALAIMLAVSVYATQKLSLINRVELDETRLITASQADKEDQQQQQQETTTSSYSVQNGTIEAGQPTPTVEPEEDTGLEGIEMIALAGVDKRSVDDGENSDTMIICCIDHNNKTIKLVSIYRDTYLNIGEDYYGTPDTYSKANSAYNLGGPEQFLTMLNLNLDLNITEFITVDFIALAKTIDLLGGLDIEMTKEELIHMNNYNVETSQVCGVEYEEVPVPDDPEFDGARTRTFHLNGSQSVSYARIRYTSGNDFRRASRQRNVLYKVKEKAMSADLGTIDQVLNEVLPLITTNLDNGSLLSMIPAILTYDMSTDDQSGFPMVHIEDDGSLTGEDCVIPVTLAYNVTQLHKLLFPEEDYYPSDRVQEYSMTIAETTGYDESYIEMASGVDDEAPLTYWSQELEDQAAASQSSSEGE